jgi:hypothetical protein
MGDGTQTGGLFGAIDQWVKKPFSSSGSAVNWILFVGLLAIAAFFWQVVLLKLTEEL